MKASLKGNKMLLNKIVWHVLQVLLRNRYFRDDWSLPTALLVGSSENTPKAQYAQSLTTDFPRVEVWKLSTVLEWKVA